MTQKRSYKQYPKEFKEEAVALVTDQGYTVPKAAEALGVATNILYRWKENVEKKNAGIILSEDERTELKSLLKEVKTLRVEKEILKKEIGLPVYFCDPQCPWQRGTNENTNRLIRQYFPKKTSLSPHTQEKLNEVATQLNERPRKTLKFKAPSHMIEKSVAMIA